MSTEAATHAPADDPQLTPDGRLRHLLSLATLPRSLLEPLLERAERYLTPLGERPARDSALKGRTVANLFFEPSTRTRASFELAAHRMSADVLNLDVNMSSRTKGESVLDTILTLQAMEVDVFVVRDASAGIPAFIARNVAPHVSVLNAGEADVSHPTQGLLDLLTIRRRKPPLPELRVAIVGDIAHSRVARSTAEVLHTFGVGELRLVGPPDLLPAEPLVPGAMLVDDLARGLRDADVVMALRIQRERFREMEGIPDPEQYARQYGITRERLRGAHPDAIVMHPGPMNRGVEIDGDVADGPQSAILEQVTNGVAVRMAVLATVTETLIASGSGR